MELELRLECLKLASALQGVDVLPRARLEEIGDQYSEQVKDRKHRTE
jgi:hypothetical protein